MPNKKRKNSIDTRRKKEELYKTRMREGSEIGRGREEKIREGKHGGKK